jgi:HSP20 family protein
MLVRWNPFKLDWLDFDDMFDNFIQSTGVKLNKKDCIYSLSIDVPGMTDKDIKLDLLNNVLTISGELKTETSSRSIYKQLSLPEDSDLSTLSAKVLHGVLTISMNTKNDNDKKSIKIPVNAG